MREEKRKCNDDITKRSQGSIALSLRALIPSTIVWVLAVFNYQILHEFPHRVDEDE